MRSARLIPKSHPSNSPGECPHAVARQTLVLSAVLMSLDADTNGSGDKAVAEGVPDFFRLPNVRHRAAGVPAVLDRDGLHDHIAARRHHHA
jgi:hypothetical protein